MMRVVMTTTLVALLLSPTACLDGWDLAAAVRALPGGGSCQVMAITGWDQQSDRQRALQAGYDDHLVKTVDTDALLRRLAGSSGCGSFPG